MAKTVNKPRQGKGKSRLRMGSGAKVNHTLMFEDNMGCEASLGDCRICGIKCSYYGRHAEAHCIGGICVCDYPFDDSMGCQASLGDCRICAVKCSAYGKGAEAHCDYRYDGGACICDFPCKEYKPPPDQEVAMPSLQQGKRTAKLCAMAASLGITTDTSNMHAHRNLCQVTFLLINVKIAQNNA
ncbi:hypothetical protein YC2023_030905 [Brassica napus]